MARVTIYDKKGQSIERDMVDARECIATGEYSFDDPTAEKPASTTDAERDAADAAARDQAQRAITVAPSESKAASRKK